MGMGSAEQKARACTPLSSKERELLRALAKHYCGVHFVRNLEGFVHNLNSPLQILWMRSEQVQQDIGRLEQKVRGGDGVDIGELADLMKKRIDSFMKGLDQLNESLGFLTKDLLGKPRSEVGEVRVNEVIQDALFLLKSDMFFKHRVEVRLELGDDLPEINGRHSDFVVILLHLVQNSLEAMIHSDVKDLGIETFQQEGDIVIRIRDTGCGISEEEVPRIFEPFFTTKHEIEYNGKTENRLGLGLPVASLLLEDYNGRVSFESGPHKTAFVVTIPF
jgi:signal transduction histidine kinase